MLPSPRDNNVPTPFLGRYLRLYGLHQLEHSISYEIVLCVRVATTRLVTSGIPATLEELWRRDPERGVHMARDEFILPRLARLQDAEDAWSELALATFEDRWQQFQQQRQILRPDTVIDTLPRRGDLIPYQPLPTALSTGSRLLRSVDNVNRVLNMAQTALTVADAALRLWHEWRSGQERLRIMEARRLLLEDAVQATQMSQDHALSQALNPGFVERYLTAGGDDEAYDILFGDLDDDTNGSKQ
jgi:hypothetical protein